MHSTAISADFVILLKNFFCLLFFNPKSGIGDLSRCKDIFVDKSCLVEYNRRINLRRPARRVVKLKLPLLSFGETESSEIFRFLRICLCRSRAGLRRVEIFSNPPFPLQFYGVGENLFLNFCFNNFQNPFYYFRN